MVVSLASNVSVCLVTSVLLGSLYMCMEIAKAIVILVIFAVGYDNFKLVHCIGGRQAGKQAN